MDRRSLDLLVFFFALVASILIALAICVYEGYIPQSLVDNFTYGELGSFGGLAAVVAVVAYWKADSSY